MRIPCACFSLIGLPPSPVDHPLADRSLQADHMRDTGGGRAGQACQHFADVRLGDGQIPEGLASCVMRSRPSLVSARVASSRRAPTVNWIDLHGDEVTTPPPDQVERFLAASGSQRARRRSAWGGRGEPRTVLDRVRCLRRMPADAASRRTLRRRSSATMWPALLDVMEVSTPASRSKVAHRR